MSAEPPDEPTLPFSNEQLDLPFEKPKEPEIEEEPLAPNTKFPAGSFIRRKARELYACGWSVRQIAEKLQTLPDGKDLTEINVHTWRKNDDWADFRRKVEQELAKDQLTRIKMTGARIFSHMDNQLCSVQAHLMEALKGKSGSGKVVVQKPPRLTDAKEIYKLLLESIDSRRALVTTALSNVSESLPLVEPSELKFTTHTPVRPRKPPELPKGEEDDGQVGEQQPSEDANGGGKGGGTPPSSK